MDDEVEKTSDGVSSFLRAARAGNLDKILDFLNNGLDINSSNNNGLNALHLASKEGHMKVITELLARGAHVDAVTKKGNTALHIASLAGQEEVVKLLIERGSKVNVQSQNGFTPLYMASQENHSEVVRYLLANNANQALATEDGFTPLAVALQQGHDKVVALLLENDAKGKVKLPALHIAAKKDDIKATTLLLQNEHRLDTTSKSGGMVNDTTKSGFTPLHIAAHYGNMSVGRLLVDRGADVNYKARNSITPLHVASKWGRVAMIQLLLDNNADIEAKTRDGLTPLHCAARSGHDQTVDILLEKGASVTAKTKNSLTPLHMAAQGDHVDCVRLLLYRKAVIDDITIDYLTPLHVVAHCGNFRTAQLLLDRKCEVNARALNGFTPLHIACKKNRIKIVELLLKYGATIEATTESGLTPLHVASFMGHLNIVIYLLQKGASPNHTTVRGETSLHLAVRANQTDILRALLRNGAQIDHAKAREQQTPLHIVSRLGNVDNLLLLLQHGASPDALTKDMYTSLHIAAKEGHDEICQILLDHGAKQSLKSKRGFTPLHIAAKNGQLRVVKKLVEHGANVDVEGKNGLSPLHVATHYNVVDVALYLLEKNANPHCISKNGYTSLHIAAKKNEMEIALTLLQHGADANAKSKNGFTPLHLATQEGNVDMVAMLLEHSAGPNMQAKNGLVPLHLAAQEDGVPAAEILKHFGVNMNQQTNAGYTPLHTACHFGQVNMVKFLIENGASVNHRTQVGYTPLHQAAQQGHVMVINELLKSGASPDMLTESGQSALSIAQRLGYISVVEILKKVTEVNVEPCQVQEKYKHIFPETMQEVPMSDSDNEGGEEIIGADPTFLYLANNELTLEESRYKGECDAFGFERSSEKYSCTSSPGAYIDDMKYISGQQKVMLSSREDFDADDDDEVKRMMTLKRKKMMNGVAEENMIASFSDASQTSVQPGEFNPDQLISMVRSAALLPQPPYVTPINRHVQSYHEALERGSIPPGILNWKSFLVSFMVDARGGAMRGCRHSGVRFIIPPNNICMPTRITCRLVKKNKLLCPPPLMEGESLASRIIEMGPVGVKFAGLIIIEVPHFASLSGKEREILILRSENGETWKEHNFFSSCKMSKEAVTACLNELEATEELSGSQQLQHYNNNSNNNNHQQHQQYYQQQQQRKICRILSSDLPQYFALVTRIKQETSTIGPGGAIISSTVVPQVQAVFPEGSLTKNTKVGLQVQPVSAELVSKYGGNRVAVSSVVTIEPRRRKFHRPITLTLPSPKAAQKGMVNNYGPGSEAPSVRLLCSIVGGTSAALWEDITDTTPLVFTNNCVSFTTSISARFWLMDCQNIQETVKMASDIYPDVTLVPFLCKFAVFARRTDAIEARLRAFCITDDKCDKILESHDRFELIARSRDVEVLEGRPMYVEMAGNLVPVSKNNEQVCLKAFTPFVENRLPFVVRLRDHHQDPAGLLAFMSEPREVRSRNDKPPTPVVTLNINLPQYVPMEDVIKQDDIVFREKYEPMKRRRDERLSKTEQWILEVSKNMLEDDYAKLGLQLGLDVDDVEKISKQFADVNEKALVVMQAWTSRCPESATGAHLEEALKEIGRSDLADLCPCDVINVTHAVGQAASKVFLDSTGFEALRLELGASSKGSSITRGMSLDVSYDEQDLIKDSGSTMDEFSDIGSTADKFGSQDGVDEVRDDTATPTKDDLRTPIKGSPSLDGFEEEEEEEEEEKEEMSTIKRKPKLIEEEVKIVKRAVHQIGAIPIEIPIATKVITESRLSEIESSYDKSQGRVVNKLNPEPEFEQVELKKPPGYVKDQVRRWENVLTEVDDPRSESPPLDADSDQHVEKQQNEISDEHSRESISTDGIDLHGPLRELKESDVDGRSEEKGDEITECRLRQTAKDTVFKVLEKLPAEKESLKSAPQLQEVASTSGTPFPQVMEAQIHLEERDVPTTSSYDYQNWEKRTTLVREEDEDHGDMNLTLSEYAYATGNHIIDLSFEEKDLIKQSESTDEDDESSLVSSVIDRSELDRKHSERDDSLNKESPLIKWECNLEESNNLQQRPDKVDLLSDLETDISKPPKSLSETQDAEKVMEEARTPDVSPVESQDVYKYRPDTDCYEYRKYRQSVSGNQVTIVSNDVIDDLTIKTEIDDEKVDHEEPDSVPNVEKIRQGLELICHGDEEAVTLLQENLVDVKQIKKLEESEPDIIGQVYVQSVVTESPPCTTTIEKKHSLPNGVEVDHKIVTTTKTTTLIYRFYSPDSEAKDVPPDGQGTTFEEPSFVATTVNIAEVTEKKYFGAQQILLEGQEEATRRTTETKSTEVVIERRSGTLEQSAAEVEESKSTEPEESLLEETVQTVQNQDTEFLDNLGLDIGPIITVTEDNSSPVDDDDFVGYYGLQSYMREQHDDSDIDVDFEGEGMKQEDLVKDQHGEDKINDGIISPKEDDEYGRENLFELEPNHNILTSSSKNDVDDVDSLDEGIPAVGDANKDDVPEVNDDVKDDSEAEGCQSVSDVEIESDDAVKISEENEDKTCFTENEILIEKADEAPTDTIGNEYVPAIETFDETLFRKLSEHLESESVAKADKPLTRSFGLLSFPEICIQAASPMTQSPEETQEFDGDEIQQVCDEIPKDSEIVCESGDNIFVEQVKETISTEESEFVGDELIGGNISAEIILGSEIPVSQKIPDGQVKDMIDFFDGDLENEKLSEIHNSKNVVVENDVGENVVTGTDSSPADDHHDVPVEISSVKSSAISHPSDIQKPDVLLDLCATESEETVQTDSTEEEAYFDKIASEKVREIMIESCRICNFEELSTKYNSIPTVTIGPAEENADDFDDEKVDSKLDQVESDLESSVLEAERVSESREQSTDPEIQKSEADILADGDHDDNDEELEQQARMLANNILEDLREVMTSWDEESRSSEQSKCDQFGFKNAERDVSSENLKMECLSGAPTSGPTHVLESPLSDFAAPDQTGFDQLSSSERQRFVIPVDSSSLMATSTSSANSDLTDGRIVSKEIESVEEKDVDEKEQQVHPRGRHVIIVDEDDDYADDESDSTKPEKGIGENEKEFAEDEEFEKMDTRDGDELCWVGPQDMEISDDDEEVSKSLTSVNATKDSKDDRKSKTIVKRVSSDSILNDPTPEQHPPVSHFQLGLNFQQDFPRAPFHTPVKISPSDSCYDFGQMQYSLDAEMSGRDAQKSSKTLPPFELKPEDLERKLSRCSGGSSTSSSVSSSSSSGHESQGNGANREDRLSCESQICTGKSSEIVDGVLPNRALAERVFSAIETSFASSQEALSSPDNMYKSVNQDLIEEHLEKVSRERLSTSSPIEPSHQSIVDSSILPETFRSPLMSPFSDLTSSGNNIFSEILSSQTSDESPASVHQKSRLGNVRVGQSPSDFITEVEECEEEDGLAKEGIDLIDLAEFSSEVKTDVRQDDDNDWSEDADYCYVCIENVKNYLVVQKNREEVKPLNNGDAKDGGADGFDKEDGADKHKDDNDDGVDEDITDADAMLPRESLTDGDKRVIQDASEPSDKVDEMYREAVLDHITRFYMNSNEASETSPVAFFSDTYTVNKLRCKQLSDELTDDVLTPDASFPSTHTPQNKTISGRFEFKTENVASCADICDDSDLCMQQAIQESLRACHHDYRDDCSDQGQDDFYSDGITSETFRSAESPNKAEKPDTLMLSEVLSGHGIASTFLDSALSPKTEAKTHCSSSSSTRIEDYSLNFDQDSSNQLIAGPTEVRSMSSEDVPEASTSSDTSAEPTILAATYDLELGAVSRIVAAYDISPDTVERKLANIQVESTLKRIMSSPEDDVFEQQQDEKSEPHDDDNNDNNSSQELKSDNDCRDEENSREDEEDVTVRSVTPPELLAMPEEIDVNECSDFMLSPSWDLCPELDHRSSIDSVGDAEFAQQADDEQSFDEGSPFESFQAREMIVSDEFAYDGSENIYDEEEYGGETDLLDDVEDQDYKDRGLQATNICSEKYSLSDDFSSTISPISKNVFEDWHPDGSDVFAETQLDDEDIEEDHSPKVSSNGSLRSGSHSDADVAGIDFVLTKAEEEHHDGNENDSLEYYCWKPRQRGEDCDDSSIISSNTEASYGSYCLNSQKNNGHEIDKVTSPLPVDMLMLGKVYDSYSAEEENEDEDEDDGDGDDEAERVVTPQSDVSECTEKKLSEIVMDMMDEMVGLETFDPFTVCYDDESSVDKGNKSIDFVSQQLESRERCVEQIDSTFTTEADDEGLEKSDSFEEITEEMLAERKAEEFVSAVIREAYLENEGSEHNLDYKPSGAPSSPLGLSGIIVHVTEEWDKGSFENNDYDEESKHGDDDYDDEEDENGDGPIENDYLSSQALDYSEAVTKSLSSEDDVDQMEEDYQASGVDDCEAGGVGREDSESYYVLSRSCEHKVMTVKRHPAGFTCKFSPKALTKNTHHQFRDPGQRCLDDSISPDDQGDSSSLDSFATVIGPSAYLEERVGDLSSLASSIHSDILPLEFAPTGDNLRIDFDSPEASKLELSCSILNTEFPATQQLHAKKENQEESVKLVTSFLQPCPDNLEATSSEESALDSDVICLEDEEGRSSSARSDDEMLNEPGDRPYGDRMMVVEYCDTMLATIREEEERLSSLSGKTSSSSSARLAESKQQQLLQLQQQQLQQKKQQQQQQKNADKDTASVSSSLLEFERLEKELQEKASNADSNGSMKTQGPRGPEGSSNETDEKASSSHSGEVAAEDNLSISSSLAEFEQLEDELKHSPSSEKVSSTNVSQGASIQSIKKDSAQSGGGELMGSNTSLQSFSIVTGSPNFEGDTNFIQQADVGSSLLEDFYDLTSKMSDQSASFVTDLVVLDQDGRESKSENSSVHSSSKYPGYQDIVQIIRDAAESDQLVSGDMMLNRSAFSDELRKSQTVIPALENSAESGAWTQSDSSFVALCTNSQASLSNLISLEDSMVSSALDDPSQTREGQRQSKDESVETSLSENEPEKFAERLCQAVLKSVTQREEIRVQRSTTEVTSRAEEEGQEDKDNLLES